MPSNIAVPNGVLTAGLNPAFMAAYEPSYQRVKDRMAGVMTIGIPSDKLTETFAYWESAPYPRRRDRSTTTPSKAFTSKSWSVTNKDWSIEVPYHRNDLQDDQLHALEARAGQAGGNFPLNHERVFFQIMTGATDSALLDAIPNAPDGAAMYATVDGAGAARFGVTNGNLLSGAGVATAAAVRGNFYTATAGRLKCFQDTEGQPLFDESLFDAGYVIYYGQANAQVFAEAFVQKVTAQASATTPYNPAGVSNVILDSGERVTLRPTQRITDNDWFIFMLGVPIKPVFHTARMPVAEAWADMSNSDKARRTLEFSKQWESRDGYGLFLPYGTVKVDN